MQDFICSSYSKSNSLSYNKTWEHVCTVSLQEPVSFNEACKHPEWKEAMKEELNVLQENDTW